MTYAECVRSALFLPQSWGFLLVGLAVGFGLARFGRWYSAVAMAFSGIIIGAVLAVTHYEINCVELIPV